MKGASGEGGLTLEELKEKMAFFAKERDWDQLRSPRNLLLALWKGEVRRGLPDWDEQEKLHLGEELSDVLLYLVRLSDICGIDLDKAALRKIELNAIKYPISLCKGSSQKHNQIKTSPGTVPDDAATTIARAAAGFKDGRIVGQKRVMQRRRDFYLFWWWLTVADLMVEADVKWFLWFEFLCWRCGARCDGGFDVDGGGNVTGCGWCFSGGMGHGCC
ncbi:unnamed protein product [Fraxinus pennsylvanica]|uniref:dCTP pyrophosphatase 1 n=1 Tax=Fraxinus pennsylvanica TaxID=56036 RepID=A0AAD2A1S3_9LAMI|nr:unnamed protein product [Fraxinus pennsylvanica]